MPRPNIVFSALSILWLCIAVPPVRAESEISAEAARLWLVDGGVIDWESGQSIDSFRVVPGVPMSQFDGHESIGAVWQPHQIREMTGGKFQWPRTTGYKKMRFRIEADGYQPSMTPWTERGGPYTKMRVYLRPDPKIPGTVVDADGNNLAGAILAIGLPNRPIVLDDVTIKGIDTPPNGRLSDRWRIPQSVRSDDAGRFRLPTETDPSAVLCVVHPKGILIQPFETIRELETGGKQVRLQLRRWAVVSGRIAWKKIVAADALLHCTTTTEYLYPNLVTSKQRTRSDDDGYYRFGHVPPGLCRVSRTIEDPDEGTVRPIGVNQTLAYPAFGVETEAGVMSEINIGGPGVTVKGNLVGLPAFDGLKVTIAPPKSNPRLVRQIGLGGNANQNNKWAVLRNRPEGDFYFRDDISVAGDGSFQIDDVMTGDYRLTVVGARGEVQFSVRPMSPAEVHIGRITVQREGKPAFGLPAAGP